MARSGLEAARQRGHDVVLLDTAGRLHVDEPMMDELVRIAGAVTPAETLLVVDAMTGQECGAPWPRPSTIACRSPAWC